RADRARARGPGPGDGRYPVTRGPVLEDLAQMAGVPLELRDPVGVRTEQAQAALEQVDPGAEAPSDPVGDETGEVRGGALQRALEPVRQPGVVLVEVAAARPGRVCGARGTVRCRGGVLLVGLPESSVAERAQL